MRQKEIALRCRSARLAGVVKQLLVESLLLSVLGGVAGSPCRRPDADAAGVDSGGRIAADQPAAGRPDPRVHAWRSHSHRYRLRLAACAAREPARSVVDAERHRRIDCRNGWVALPPEGAGRGAGRAQLPAPLRRRLFVRSLQNLKTTDTGVALDNLVTFQLSPDLSGYNDERGTIFYRDLLERLRSAPGVKSAAIANVPILSGDEWDSTMSVEGHRARTAKTCRRS